MDADDACEADGTRRALTARAGDKLAPNTDLAARRTECDREQKGDDLLRENDDIEDPHEVGDREAPERSAYREAGARGDRNDGPEQDERGGLGTPRDPLSRAGREASDEDDKDQDGEAMQHPRAGLAQDMRVPESRRALGINDRCERRRCRDAEQETYGSPDRPGPLPDRPRGPHR